MCDVAYKDKDRATATVIAIVVYMAKSSKTSVPVKTTSIPVHLRYTFCSSHVLQKQQAYTGPQTEGKNICWPRPNTDN